MSWQKRIIKDLKDLTESGFQVRDEKGGEDFKMDYFIVKIKGPVDTPYENCDWTLRFTIPEKFPFSSPSVGFIQRIYHPNVDEESGTICLDALNSNWSPTFTIRHIAETLVPYLLAYPNPDDPLNKEAASLMKANKLLFEKKAKTHSAANCLRE